MLFLPLTPPTSIMYAHNVTSVYYIAAFMRAYEILKFLYFTYYKTIRAFIQFCTISIHGKGGGHGITRVRLYATHWQNLGPQPTGLYFAARYFSRSVKSSHDSLKSIASNGAQHTSVVKKSIKKNTTCILTLQRDKCFT